MERAMIEGQLNIFDVLYPKFKIDKPIRLIELFGGYGSQALALKYLGVKFEHWKLVEWAVKSIQAYKDIHFPNDNTDYSKNFTKEEIIEALYYLGISQNYNEPMKREQIARLKEKQLRTIFNNIQATHNLVDIQQVKSENLKIEETDKYCYIMTYSFPCQDLSLAGKGKGMSDTSTRSGLLWEVERILSECYELGEMPQVLLMENVPQVHSEDNLPDFNKWKDRLEELGYKNYFQDLIATDYGIPQTRNRCFMVSILGDYNYTFPKPIPLKLKLKDMLEDNVSEKYYLSDKMMDYIVSKDDKYKVNENNLVINRDVACSKTTREGNTRADTTDYVSDELPENYKLKPIMNLYDLGIKRYNRRTGVVLDTEGSSSTLLARNQGDNSMIVETCLLKNKGTEISRLTDNANTLMARDYKGFGNQEMNAVIEKGINNKNLIKTLEENEVNDGDYIDAYNHNVKEGVSGTILTGVDYRNQSFIAVKNNNKKGYLEAHEGDGVNISSRMEYQRGNVQKNKIQTIDTMGGESKGVVLKDLRIRKLTPRECMRLMGVKDEDYDRCAKNQSDSSLYHLAGDSIVVDVLCYLFKQMIGDDINE